MSKKPREDLVPIGEAARLLGVSIDTIRRRDKKNILHSVRPDGKTRFFSLAEIESLKYSRPLSISEAAAKLELSRSTLRRLEKNGLIRASRNSKGERIYDQETIKVLLKSDSDSIDKFIDDQPHDHFDWQRFRKVLARLGLFILALPAFIIIITTLLSLLFPNEIGSFLGYEKKPSSVNVLGAQTQNNPISQANEALGRVIEPVATISVAVVKKTSSFILASLEKKQIEDINEIFALDNGKNIRPLHPIKLPTSAYLSITDPGPITNLNADYVRGRTPGIKEGNLAVLGANNSILGLKLSGVNLGLASVTSSLIADNAVKLATQTTGDYVASLTAGAGLTGTASGEASTPSLAVGGGNGITVNADNITLDLSTSGTTTTTSSNSGLELTSEGGRILGGCSSNQILKWNSTASAWECNSDSTGSGLVLDDVYTNDQDKIMPVNQAAGLTFQSSVAGNIAVDLRSTGDFVIQSSGTTFAAFDHTGSGMTLTVGSNSTSALQVSQSGTASGGSFRFTNSGTTASGVVISNTAGTLTTALDISDSSGIVNAINVGPNTILGSTAAIDFTNFDVGTGGAITVAAGQGLDTNAAGTLILGNITATTLNIGNTAATTLSIGAGGALTRAINIGTGTGVDTISIGTGSTGADVIAIGQAAAGISLTSANWSITNNGLFSITPTVATGNNFALTNSSLTSGILLNVTGTSTGTSGTASVFSLSATSSPTSGSSSISTNYFNLADTASGTFSGTSTGLNIRFQNQASVTHTQNAVAISNAAVGSFTDTTTEVLLLLDQADTTSTGNTAVTDALRITNSGGSTLTNAITIGTASQAITTAINLASTGITTDISLQNAETIDNDVNGTVAIKDNGSTTLLSASTTAFSINLDDTTTRTERLCHGGGDAGTGVAAVSDCSGTPGDYAENYGTTDSSIEAGDVVVIDPSRQGAQIENNGQKGSKAWIIKSQNSYAKSVLGVVSTAPNEVIGQNFDPSENPRPVALNGRLPVKISSVSSPIKTGDLLTSSSDPGRAMKAEKAGVVIGKALEDWDPSFGKDKIVVFVNISLADPNDILTKLSVSGDGSLLIPKLTVGNSNSDQSTSSSSSISVLDTINDLKSRIEKLEQNQNSTPAAKLIQSDQGQSSNLIASVSATLSAADKILTDSNVATLSALTVTGKTNLYDLGIVGNLNVGLIYIDGLQGSLNSLSQTLKIQSDKIADVSFEGDSVVIDKSGNFNLKEGRIVGNENIRGISIQVDEGKNEIQITFKTPRPTPSYAVSVSPSWLTQVAVKDKKEDGFTINFSNAAPTDAHLDWITID